MNDVEGGSELAPHLQTGRRGEAIAAAYLREQGWEIETQNFETKFGELDIVASRVVEDGATLVAFVEVKSRKVKPGSATSPELSVTARKRRKLVRMGRAYAQRYGRGKMGYRFDVIAVEFGEDSPVIRHYEGAFDSRGRPY